MTDSPRARPAAPKANAVAKLSSDSATPRAASCPSRAARIESNSACWMPERSPYTRYTLHPL
jgi:hypothetical protein